MALPGTSRTARTVWLSVKVYGKTLLYFSEIVIQLLKDLEGEENFQVLVSARDEQKGDFYLRVVNKGGKIILT